MTDAEVEAVARAQRQDIVCPFCDEGGFDRIGLKMHLVMWCEPYDKVDEEMQAEQERFARKDYSVPPALDQARAKG